MLQYPQSQLDLEFTPSRYRALTEKREEDESEQVHEQSRNLSANAKDLPHRRPAGAGLAPG